MAFQELNFLSLKTETKWMKLLLHFLWKETDSLVVLLKTQEFGHYTTDWHASSAWSSRTLVSSRNASLLENHCDQKVLLNITKSSYHIADSGHNSPADIVCDSKV